MTDKEFYVALMALVPVDDWPSLEALRVVMEERAEPLRAEGEEVATTSLGIPPNPETQTEVNNLFDTSGLPLVTMCRLARSVWSQHGERAMGHPSYRGTF